MPKLETYNNIMHIGGTKIWPFSSPALVGHCFSRNNRIPRPNYRLAVGFIARTIATARLEIYIYNIYILNRHYFSTVIVITIIIIIIYTSFSSSRRCLIQHIMLYYIITRPQTHPIRFALLL